jgi:16S rRNA (adenine1518-N6/adenine1519-N6)-dimethyltransferase
VRCTYAVDDEPEVDFDWMRTLVRAAFNQRRKMLRNSLSLWTKDQDLTLPNDWGRRRAEALSPRAYIDLAAYLDAHAAPRSATE